MEYTLQRGKREKRSESSKLEDHTEILVGFFYSKL
jgi:hypothetical protein